MKRGKLDTYLYLLLYIIINKNTLLVVFTSVNNPVTTAIISFTFFITPCLGSVSAAITILIPVV